MISAPDTGYEGRHNLIYWDCGDYLGLGPAAHSCMGGKRFCYAPDTAAFLQDAAAPIMDGNCGAEDYLILQLRLRKGLDLAAYKARLCKVGDLVLAVAVVLQLLHGVKVEIGGFIAGGQPLRRVLPKAESGSIFKR